MSASPSSSPHSKAAKHPKRREHIIDIGGAAAGFGRFGSATKGRRSVFPLASKTSTFAGSHVAGAADGIGSSATFQSPAGVALDRVARYCTPPQLFAAAL